MGGVGVGVGGDGRCLGRAGVTVSGVQDVCGYTLLSSNNHNGGM